MNIINKHCAATAPQHIYHRTTQAQPATSQTKWLFAHLSATPQPASSHNQYSIESTWRSHRRLIVSSTAVIISPSHPCCIKAASQQLPNLNQMTWLNNQVSQGKTEPEKRQLA
ncbi:MAG: hypothetical protein HC767_07280 [Akkermansiaceae bacterium]|nr:hypothetical protein [Akkermansiaceae bacterium]